MSIHDTDLPDWEGVPLVVKPKIAWKMLACSNTRGYELITARRAQFISRWSLTEDHRRVNSPVH